VSASPTPGAAALVITGPTSGGKTGLASEIARRTGRPILSLDSMKVYRRLDIGTAKPSPMLRAELCFELIDLREPWESFSAADYLESWREAASRRPGPCLVSGGTTFYLRALRDGLFEGPTAAPAVRARLAEEAERSGIGALHRRLADVDPVAAARIHATDLRRIVRALEVQETSGEPLTAWQARRRPLLDPDRTWLIGVFRRRAELHARIDERVERMFAAGWVQEVRALLDAHDPPWGPEAAQSIGYERVRTALVEGRDPRNQLTGVRQLPVEWWEAGEVEELLARIEGADLEKGVFPADEARRERKCLL
jgi:tRNA dimethylallyltransferase